MNAYQIAQDGPDDSWKSSKSNSKGMLTKLSSGMMPMSNSKVEKADDSSIRNTTKSSKCKYTEGVSSANDTEAMTSGN